ncbi:MAG TPA: hypothetical protein VJB14_12385 [Planctomycetota bacterium]|nr:hypothetical protein [Planctomycetota bacterium]
MRTLFRCLRYPEAQLYAFDGRKTLRREVALATWGWLAAIAVAGTILYGASLPTPSALRLLGATGLSWCLFGPALVWITRRRISTCAHACLVTMAYGIGVLAVGAGINFILGPGALFNAVWVGLSNVVMAAALARQLSTVGVRGWRTLAAWAIVLDGAGLAFFWAFGGFR